MNVEQLSERIRAHAQAHPVADGGLWRLNCRGVLPEFVVLRVKNERIEMCDRGGLWERLDVAIETAFTFTPCDLDGNPVGAEDRDSTPDDYHGPEVLQSMCTRSGAKQRSILRLGLITVECECERVFDVTTTPDGWYVLPEHVL